METRGASHQPPPQSCSMTCSQMCHLFPPRAWSLAGPFLEVGGLVRRAGRGRDTLTPGALRIWNIPGHLQGRLLSPPLGWWEKGRRGRMARGEEDRGGRVCSREVTVHSYARVSDLSCLCTVSTPDLVNGCFTWARC